MNTTTFTNGFEGVLVNETLENEISKRTNELDKMNEFSNWTNEMNERGIVLERELEDLLSARVAFQNAQ